MYPRSWIDGLVQRIARLQIAPWQFYFLLVLAAAILNHIVFWIDGSLPAGTVDSVRVTDAGYVVFFIALYHHLAVVAKRSFSEFRLVLGSTELEADVIEHRLTTLPREYGWLAITLGIWLAVGAIQSEPASFGLVDNRTLFPLIYQYLYATLSFSTAFALIIQTVRQLSLVNELHRRATRINLFHLAPVHAMASLSARAGMGLIALMVFNGIAERSNLTDLNLAFLAGLALLAVCVFLGPLLGMRRRLKAEKARLIGQTDAAIEHTIRRIHERVESDRYDELGGLNTAMSALTTERNLVQGISAWPWEGGTLRGFATSLMIPIFVFLVTRLLGRFL